MRLRVAIVLFAAAACGACSDGPGRPPAFADAEARIDRGFEDARPFPDADPHDAGFPDSELALFDAGRPPDYPFTGIFSILGDPNRLFAREVSGRLEILIGQLPYIYTGTITAGGQVVLQSNVLLRSGCAEARITGYYERPAAAFFLEHVTCGPNGQRLQAMLRGGFDANFDPRLSGIYELTAVVIQDFQGCYRGPAGPHVVRYGVAVLEGTQLISIYTAIDALPPTSYFGSIRAQDLTFGTLEPIFAMPGPFDAAMNGQLMEMAVPNPPRFIAQRDTYDARLDCGYRLALDGVRIAAP